MKKSLVITKPLADKLMKLPAEVVGGAVKYLIGRVFCDVPEDAKYRPIEKVWESSRQASQEDCERILAYLNGRLKTRYTLTDSVRSKINARFAEGATVEDFIIVIDTKAEEWIGTEAARYLRPETLFGTKFAGYLNQRAVEQQGEKKDEGSFDTDSFFAASLERSNGKDIADNCPFLK